MSLTPTEVTEAESTSTTPASSQEQAQGQERPSFPRRAIVTAGMPYGNKDLHFGHISGVFVPADYYARFLRDRIGASNVLFVSGTDCYGSPIMEGFRKKVEGEGYTGTIVDYVEANHERQAEALRSYDISLDLFAGSALDPAREFHARLTDKVIRRLRRAGGPVAARHQAVLRPAGGQLPQRPPGHRALPGGGLQEREGLRRRVRPGPPVRARGAHQAGVAAQRLRPRASPGEQLVL